VVSEDLLQEANGLIGMATNGAAIAGPAIAGVW